MVTYVALWKDRRRRRAGRLRAGGGPGRGKQGSLVGLRGLGEGQREEAGQLAGV